MHDHLRRKPSRYFVLLFLLLPALYAYNPIPLYFLNDDFIHIPLSQLRVWGQRNSIRPVNDISLFLDSIIWHNNAAGYHLTNLLIHCIDSFLVYKLALIFLKKIKVHREQFWACSCGIFFGATLFIQRACCG
jgi:hypothetical protein